MTVEQLLEKILNQLINFEQRFDNNEMKLDNFQKRLEQVEQSFTNEITKVNSKMATKVSQAEFFILKSEFESLVESERIESFMKESHDKRLNILVHSPGKTENAWET